MIAETAGFEVIAVDTEPGWANVPGLDSVHLTADSFIVLIKTDHISDEAVLRQVIISPVRYIGMIGSRKKCQTILDHLKVDGFLADSLQRIFTPIGLDLGGPSPEEIAVAILAEVIAVRCRRRRNVRSY